ncbi:MAG: exodeoxyribonuclease III [Nitrosomonadales bacterium]|nr:exodeoxyribonuclease III [Nitrosomonadales bacterium]
MKLATWNVNSLKVRLPQVLDWLAANPVDALCLQETKQQDKDFPQAEFQAAGYHSVFSGQKTYNGVAILSRTPAGDMQFGIPDFPDEHKRVIAATFTSDSIAKVKQGGDERTTQTVLIARPGVSEEANAVSPMQSDRIRVVCVYVPNGQSVDSDKYRYKLAWLAALRDWLKQELKRYPQLVLLGDYNIAPEDRDVYDPVAWQGNVLVSEPERQQFRNLLQLGLRDSFRLFEQPEKSYSWWDYRMMAFRRNLGLRLDHILVSEPLVAQCKSCVIDKAPRKLERPSDHTPVIVELG